MATTGKVTRQDREHAWNELHRAVIEGKTRPFYRAVNKHGLMYAGKLCNLDSIFTLNERG